ncbi:apses-domain-containing protein [Coniophora puteana RWD-64-598 SS2]|uniref:Apses-domain-containing protein n=1 Tax=Coniophora puteana (strain RWD-64-598) TaxID=741705 RepID=A0A5M3MTN1_CONPW|nr:apses-domain-containing protein [Coniophora puteana RWD-64-598 SS2]EIW82513.1 apses-domain-containing protein [Coniophora puteana RWD-64-598 SS2]
MPDGQIFKATYSGIPVYEMMYKSVAVMRRRSDSWLNATQILKVAGFDKPQRTRVLEREVQKGEHEKVQGGYGKYQGTWIPLERGLALAKQYGCETALRPIIEFQPTGKSPPLAPKHLVSTSTAVRPVRRGAAVPEPVPVPSTRSRRHIIDTVEDDSDLERLYSAQGSEDGSMSPSPSQNSSSSRTPSPFGDQFGRNDMSLNGPGRRNAMSRHLDEHYDEDISEETLHRASNANDLRAYCDEILEYFISDTNQVPQILITPPTDFDPNMAIDDDGHTALHWASAMGRLRIVKLLLTAGADIFKVNKAGQTALMRSVMFANNYDIRKFPELFELLLRSTLNIDNFNRTVFHHIVDVAMSKGKTHAARYYMETVLTRLADYPKELADVINFQDEDGETALTMAARCRSKRLVKLLIDHGADPKIVNFDGKSTEDYILEDERFRSSPGPTSRLAAMSFRNAQASIPPTVSVPPVAVNGDRPPLHHSVAGQKASTRCVNEITTMLDSLATSFDRELQDKERDMNQAHALLQNIQQEILESHRAVNQLKAKADGLQQAKTSLTDLENQLLDKMGRRYRFGWEKWVKDEENREKGVRDAANGELAVTPATKPYRTDDDLDGEASMELSRDKAKGKRKALPQEEDISDLLRLYSDVPANSDAMRHTCNSLRDEITQSRKRRKSAFEELVTFQAEAGTGGRMAEYRRLIGAGCGGVPPSEVENIIGMLLETLESEEPSSSSGAWSGSKVAPISVV